MPVPSDPRVLIDFRTADDAGVFTLSPSQALVQTVDFFTPIVDDPWAYGRIAGANALSDVFAMGGQPLTALAIAAFPAADFDVETVRAIFAGGLSALQEAGVALLGGHTVQDQEVKFGYAVTGVVAPNAVWSNAGARPGDVLVLTKPIGTGIIATAGKFQRAPAEVLATAVASMQRLNGPAAQAVRGRVAVHGCTDITGFGLIGHAVEMGDASGVTMRITAAAVPVLDGARALAMGNQTGGSRNNAAHFSARVDTSGISDEDRVLLHDPQTSGGLLLSIAAADATVALGALADAGVDAHIVGEVHERPAAGPGERSVTSVSRAAVVVV